MTSESLSRDTLRRLEDENLILNAFRLDQDDSPDLIGKIEECLLYQVRNQLEPQVNTLGAVLISSLILGFDN